MNMYRMSYVRAGELRRTTFTAEDSQQAWSFASKWCRRLGLLLAVSFVRPLKAWKPKAKA